MVLHFNVKKCVPALMATAMVLSLGGMSVSQVQASHIIRRTAVRRVVHRRHRAPKVRYVTYVYKNGTMNGYRKMISTGHWYINRSMKNSLIKQYSAFGKKARSLRGNKRNRFLRANTNSIRRQVKLLNQQMFRNPQAFYNNRHNTLLKATRLQVLSHGVPRNKMKARFMVEKTVNSVNHQLSQIHAKAPSAYQIVKNHKDMVSNNDQIVEIFNIVNKNLHGRYGKLSTPTHKMSAGKAISGRTDSDGTALRGSTSRVGKALSRDKDGRVYENGKLVEDTGDALSVQKGKVYSNGNYIGHMNNGHLIRK